ncbi:MAG: glycine--tRNA ligase, partial [Candidatus Hydrogenedentota bacterium]
MKDLVSLCARRGFIFQSSEIYGGINGCWDFGPLGVELKRNIKNDWWYTFVQQREDIVGLDASIIMHPEVWVASGHVEQFHDIVVDCKECKNRYRQDHIEGDRCPYCGGELTAPLAV